MHFLKELIPFTCERDSHQLRIILVTSILFTISGPAAVLSCVSSDMRVGVCLHVYLERDFLSVEGIVYPRHPTLNNNRFDYNVQGAVAPPRGWMEGPEQEDYCRKLKQVIECFEKLLFSCTTARSFFSFRHLLHSLDTVHHFLCDTPATRKNRFSEFLRTIDCAERALQDLVSSSCHRHNVTTNVWNKILRLEIGTEICDSLSTQRACLLEKGYLHQYCRRPTQVQIYTQVSGLFLSTWCKVPLLPGPGAMPHGVGERPYWGDSTATHSRPAYIWPTLSILIIFIN